MWRTPKARRRSFQFSLRTLIVVMLLASIGMSWIAVNVQRAQRRRNAVEAIVGAGGYVTYEYDNRGEPEPPEPVWLRNMLGDDFFAAVNTISFATRSGVEHLVAFPELKALILSGTRVTDADLEYVNGLTELRGLLLEGTSVTDVGLEHVKGLTQLRELDLSSTQVTDAGLEHLKRFSNLRQLNLDGTRVTPDGIVKLKKSLPTCSIGTMGGALL
jgi:hypothetical protein